MNKHKLPVECPHCDEWFEVNVETVEPSSSPAVGQECLCKGGIRGKNCFDYHPIEDRQEPRRSAEELVGEPNKKIRIFLKWLFEEIFEGSPEGCDIQDKAEELGLLIPIKVDPEKHEACKEYDTDTLLFPYWTEEARAKTSGEK